MRTSWSVLRNLPIVWTKLGVKTPASLTSTRENRRTTSPKRFQTSIINTAVPTRRFRSGCSGRPCRRPVSSDPGARSRGWACRAHPPAVPAEISPVGPAGGFGDDLHPPGDLGLRQPEHLLPAANLRRPDGEKGYHGGGSDGYGGALGPRRFVLERIMVIRPLPSSQYWTSPPGECRRSHGQKPGQGWDR